MQMTARLWAMLVALAVLWGASFFFVAIATHELPPFTLVLWRVTQAWIILLPIALLAGGRLPRDRNLWLAFLVMALFNNVIPFSLISKGQQTVPSGLASVINATTPLFTAVLAHFFAKGEPLTIRRVAGVLVGVSGVAVLMGPEVLEGRGASVFGMALLLGASFSYGCAAVWGRRLREVPPLVAACSQLMASCGLLAVLAALFDRPWDLPMPSLATVGAMTGLAVLSTALAYILFYRILSAAGGTNVMLVTLLIPVAGLALGVLILKEPLLARHVIGALVIGSALLVIDGRILARLGLVKAATKSSDPAQKSS